MRLKPSPHGSLIANVVVPKCCLTKLFFEGYVDGVDHAKKHRDKNKGCKVTEHERSAKQQTKKAQIHWIAADIKWKVCHEHIGLVERQDIGTNFLEALARRQQ